MSDEYHKSIISGWLEYRSETEYFAELRIIDYGNNKQEIEN